MQSINTNKKDEVDVTKLRNFDFYKLKFENKFTNTPILVCNQCGHCITITYYEIHKPYTMCEECKKKVSFMLASYESLEQAVEVGKINYIQDTQNANK